MGGGQRKSEGAEETVERKEPGEVEGKATRVESGPSRRGESPKSRLLSEEPRDHEGQGARAFQAQKGREGSLGKPPSRGRGGTAGSTGGSVSRGGLGESDRVKNTCVVCIFTLMTTPLLQ